ncbi:MAG: RluA family pseudouridine synthase [Burkholderiales bacterium]
MNLIQPDYSRESTINLAIPDTCSGLRLDRALVQLIDNFSRSRMARWIKSERVHVNGKPASPSQKVWAGDHIRVEPEFEVATEEPAPIALDIVHEDAAILVLNKPPGLVVHPGAGNRGNTLLNALLHHSRALAAVPRAGIVHRLDKDTSGLLAIAKTLSAHANLVGQLKTRTMTREYIAIVHGRLPASGTVEAAIGRHPARRTQMSVVASGKPAATNFKTIERFGDATLAKVTLATGRTHQIRVHMQSIGHPIIGDRVYGLRRGGRKVTFSRQALHAARLQFAHPSDEVEVSFTAELPADMQALLQELRARA